MYAKLGNITFENRKGFTGSVGLNEFSKASSVTYAEHKPLSGKPLLQATGPSLSEVTLSMRFHASFCNPEEELSAMKSSMENFEVLPLLLGNGRKEGEFVIMSINNVVEDADAEGNVFSYMVNCTLKEYTTPDRLRAEQEANRRNALAVGGIKPVAKLKLNPPTPPQDIAKSVSGISINQNLISQTVEQKGGTNSIINRNTITQSAEAIQKYCTDMRDKYENFKGDVATNSTISAIRNSAEQVHNAASMVKTNINIPGDFINSNRQLTRTVLDLKTIAHPIVLKSIIGQ